MLLNNYKHIHIYENCSANMLCRDVTHFLADYKGAEAGQRSQPKIGLIVIELFITVFYLILMTDFDDMMYK